MPVRRLAPLSIVLLHLTACAGTALPPSAQPPRHVELSGTMNTRDLGGYRTEDGMQVAWGRLYRSDELSDISRADAEELQRRGLRRVFDFRTDAEREGHLGRELEGVERVRLTMAHPSMDPELVMNRILRGDAENDYFRGMLVRANRGFAIDHANELAELVQQLAEPGALPALFHCTYGKDRTGFAAAMVLSLLGVPWDTVMQDYLLSNLYLEQHNNRMARLIWFASLFRISQEESRQLLGVHAEYLEAAREAIIETYGSIGAYHEAIGLDADTIERLRAALLEPAEPTEISAPEADSR